MSKTINTKFDELVLPRWAKKDPTLVKMAKEDLAFRIEVIKADTYTLRNVVWNKVKRMRENLDK